MPKSFYIDSNYSSYFALRSNAYGHFILGHLLKTFAFLYENNLLNDLLNNEVTLYMNKINETSLNYYKAIIGDDVYRVDNCPSGVDKVFLTENNDKGFGFSESNLSDYSIIGRSTNKVHCKYFPFLRDFVVKKYGYRKPVNLIYASRKITGPKCIDGVDEQKWARDIKFKNENEVISFLKELAERNNLMFKNVHFPDISVKDRIIAALESKIMFGFFGAQLLNVIFQPKDSLLMEFFIRNGCQIRKCCRAYKEVCGKDNSLLTCRIFSEMSKCLEYKYLRINAGKEKGSKNYKESALFGERHKIIIDRFVKRNLNQNA